VVVGGMFHTIQCTQSPIGASGSSTIRTKDLASVGTLEICSGGLMFSPSHVYFGGRFWLFSNAWLVRCMVVMVSGLFIVWLVGFCK